MQLEEEELEYVRESLRECVNAEIIETDFLVAIPVLGSFLRGSENNVSRQLSSPNSRGPGVRHDVEQFYGGEGGGGWCTALGRIVNARSRGCAFCEQFWC